MRQKKTTSKTMIPASLVKQLSGWDNNDLIKMRKHNLVDYEGKHRSIMYVKETLPTEFFKKPVQL